MSDALWRAFVAQAAVAAFRRELKAQPAPRAQLCHIRGQQLLVQFDQHGEGLPIARSCGQPNAKRAVVTSYGAKREEWDYSRLIVIEDGVVIGSLGWEPK